MNEFEQPLQLAKLRASYGQFLPSGQSNDFVQITPGRKRKVYGASVSQGTWVYTAEFMRAFGDLKPHAELLKLVNNQALEEVRQQANDALQQLVFRALTGDKLALRSFIATLEKSVRVLDRLVKSQRENVIEEAEKWRHLPVLLSLNKAQTSHVIKKITDLRVGSKTLPRPRASVDPEYFWTKLALDAYEVCRLNIQWVPLLRATFLTEARVKRVSQKFWGENAKENTANFFYIPNSTDVFRLADWQLECENLREPITISNFKQWCRAVKGCVLEYWRSYQEEYSAALAHFAGHKKNAKDYHKRKRAVESVIQAFETAAGVR